MSAAEHPASTHPASVDRGLEHTEEFDRAFELLEAGRSLFLTGRAGTGKSTLVREFLRTTERTAVVAAPTGIAALNVGGWTIHRLFGLRPGLTVEDVASGRYHPGRFAKTLQALDTLVIDEASMVRADLLDQLVAALERFGPRPGERFGGVQLVLVGDLLQLPPVVTEAEREFFSTRYETPYFFSADRWREEDFPTLVLTRVFRQVGDSRLTGVLNSIREGVLLGGARGELNARVDPDFEPDTDEFWLTLTTTNRMATARNRRQLDRLPADLRVSTARTTGELDGFDRPTDEQLAYKHGAQIMLLTNDPGGRWVNGTMGRIVEVSTTADDEPTVQVQLRDGAVVDVAPHTWEITRPVVSGGSLTQQVVGTFTQLPFALAWAITIHKSQGQTLDRLIVDLTGGTFAVGQLYVALSRVTSLDGLVLRRGVRPKDMKTDRRILRFLRRAGSAGSADGGEGADGAASLRRCGIGLLTVGEEGTRSRPRPVEVAVAFEDGTAISTLIDPQRDLADARTRFGISAADVLAAPTLEQAWALIGPAVAGCTPVGADVDATLGMLDFERKRLGSGEPMPFGVEVGEAADRREPLPAEVRRGLDAPRALDRARAALQAHAAGSGSEDGATGFGDPGAGESDLLGADTGADIGSDAGQDQDGDDDGAVEAGRLLTRDPQVPAPAFADRPQLAAILDVGREVGAALLDAALLDAARLGTGASATPRRDSGEFWLATARRLVAEQLRAGLAEQPVPRELADRLAGVERHLGHPVHDPEAVAAGTAADLVLGPGVRICFTGDAADPGGRIWSREQMHALAAEHGLRPVDTVTKTKCDALVVAELGTQSNKAKKARQYEKPVLVAEDFLAWAQAG